MKILILQNQITDQQTLDRGIEIFKQEIATIGLVFDFTIKTIDRQFTSIPFSNDVNSNGYIVNPKEIAEEEAKVGDFDITVLVYDWSKVSPQPTNPADNGEYIQIPCQWYATYPEVFAEFLLHEFCHEFFWKYGGTDVTHNYIPEFSQKQRYEYYLYLLKPFASKITPSVPVKPSIPTVTITREIYSNIEVLGTLTVALNGVNFSCKTLERPDLNNAPNISCIPKGTYTVVWSFSPKFLKYTYEVKNVPKRSGIRIHLGNYVKNYLGCIGLGERIADINGDGVMDITSTGNTVNAFNNLMGKKSFTLIIK